MANAEALQVEVVFSPAPRAVWRWQGVLPAGSVLLDALNASGLRLAHPALDIERCVAGVWGRVAALSQPLADGDRVEVYRPLRVDPKEARRLRYRRQRGLAEAVKTER